jgi:hypothetical protein
MNKDAKITKFAGKTSELLRLACVWAEQDREALLDSFRGCTSDLDEDFKAELRGQIRALKAYRLKRWGKTRGEVMDEERKSILASS